MIANFALATAIVGLTVLEALAAALRVRLRTSSVADAA